MVNASLNWASILGIVLVLCWIPSLNYSISGLNRYSSSNSGSVARILFFVWSIFAPPLCGGILFFQGWRLDPILQFGYFLLVGGVILQLIEIDNINRKQRSPDVNPFEDLKPLEPLEEDNSTKTEVRSIDVSSIDVELTRLKDLRDKELITDEELQKLRQKILNN